ncbi:MAG: hypothetical protein RL362_1417 [Bacteroidota bacterium]|jgi:uncharacterized integral membrane protein (TIGR00697 family)
MSLNFQPTRREWTFIFLAGMMITNAVTAELISSKLIDIPIQFSLGNFSFGPFTTIVGVLPWPIVFILTDLLNEFYGEKAIRRLSWISAAMIAYCFLIVTIALKIPASTIVKGNGLADDNNFNIVFGQANWVIFGSITAFLLSQLLDTYLFHWIKNKTGNRMIWLRSTGSTVLSQMIDSIVVLYIGFVLPGKITWSEFIQIFPVNYSLKLIIAISLTPIIYLGHWAMKKWLKSEVAPV